LMANPTSSSSLTKSKSKTVLSTGDDPYWEGHLVQRHERLEEGEAEHFDGDCG
jgi:hypothetical protein